MSGATAAVLSTCVAFAIFVLALWAGRNMDRVVYRFDSLASVPWDDQDVWQEALDAIHDNIRTAYALATGATWLAGVYAVFMMRRAAVAVGEVRAPAWAAPATYASQEKQG